MEAVLGVLTGNALLVARRGELSAGDAFSCSVLDVSCLLVAPVGEGTAAEPGMEYRSGDFGKKEEEVACECVPTNADHLPRSVLPVVMWGVT